MISARVVARAAVVGAMVMLAAGAAKADTHAPWPADWNNWSDPALWVPVGNPGNVPDTRYNGISVGAVAYTFNMGKFEVTAGQYTAFLNAVAKTDTYGLYNYTMADPVNYLGCNIQQSGVSGSYTYSVASDWANRPVNYVSWGDAARFANWLTNGQPNGDQGLTTTENGSYHLAGANTDPTLLAVTRIADGARTPGKKYYFIPTEDEWYKAAYHDNYDWVMGNYFDYPTATDSVPSNVLGNPDPGNSATFYSNGYTIGSPYWRTEVGDHENSGSPYWTFDQGGNLWEWNEAVIGSYRGLRGGCFLNNDSYLLAADRGYGNPSSVGGAFGFRVSEVPEPATLVLLAAGAAALVARRRKKN